MKFIWFIIIPLIALVVCIAHACPKGDSEWEGACTVDIQPETAVQTYKPSDEKPPKDKMPSYERAGIKVIDIKPQSTVDDEISAAQAEDARLAGQGKKP